MLALARGLLSLGTMKRLVAVVVLFACVSPPIDDAADDAAGSFLSGKADGAGWSAAEVAGVLALVNTASLAVLDDHARLDVRAARGIVAHRDGADAVAGTADDDRFDDLAELDAIPYVGPVAFARLLDHAYALDLVDAVAPVAPCLLISEYLEGAGNYNKALELWNCGTAPLPLTHAGVCLVRDAATTCSHHTLLASAGTLAPGAVLTLCRSRGGTFNDPMPTLRDRCQLEAPGTMTFSGNDRLVVFDDADRDGRFGAGDPVYDAFGWIARPPATELWADQVLRRCRPESFDGGRFFPYLDYFTRTTRHDHADYGVAPTATACP